VGAKVPRDSTVAAKLRSAGAIILGDDYVIDSIQLIVLLHLCYLYHYGPINGPIVFSLQDYQLCRNKHDGPKSVKS
jgi:hypothetical protein